MNFLLCVGSGIGNVILQLPTYYFLCSAYDTVDILVGKSCPKDVIIFLKQVKQERSMIFYFDNTDYLNKHYDCVLETRSFTGGKSSSIKYNSKKVLTTNTIFTEIDYLIYDETKMEFEVLRRCLGISYNNEDLVLCTKKKNKNNKIALFNTSKSGFQTKRKINQDFLTKLIITLLDRDYEVYSYGFPNEYIKYSTDCTSTNLQDAIEGIDECSYFIAPDMGLSFIAIALGLNGSIFFGPTAHNKMITPILRSNINIISDQSSCSYLPCYLTPIQHRLCDIKCMRCLEKSDSIRNILNHIENIGN